MAAKINWHRYGTIITSLSPYVYIRWCDVTGYMVTIRSPFCGHEMLQCVEIRDEDLSCCSVSLLKVSICQYMPTNKAYLIDITLANISQSFTHKMAPKTSWQRYETKLSDCHPICITYRCRPGKETVEVRTEVRKCLCVWLTEIGVRLHSGVDLITVDNCVTCKHRSNVVVILAFLLFTKRRERKCVDSIGTVLVP